MYYGVYNIYRNKMYENDDTKARRRNLEGCCFRFLYYMSMLLLHYLKVGCNYLEMYTVNLKTITKVIKQKVIISQKGDNME